MVAALKEIATIFFGGLALAASSYTYIAIPSIYFPSKDCIMTYHLFPLFILPMLHFFQFIAYLYRFFAKGDCQFLNRIVTVTTYCITLCVYLFYIVPTLQPPSSTSHSPPIWIKPSIISPAVTGCLKNGDVCQNLANSSDFSAIFRHDPILDYDELYATETGYVALGCMEAYVESIRKALKVAVLAISIIEPTVTLIFFLMKKVIKKVKKRTRAVIAI